MGQDRYTGADPWRWLRERGVTTSLFPELRLSVPTDVGCTQLRHASLIMSSRQRLLFSIAVLLAVYWVGVAGYLIIEPKTRFLDAMYMVVITLGKVGYREVVPVTPATMIWTILVILFGAAAAGAAIGSLTSLIVQGDVGRLIGSRKVEAKIKNMDSHVIVCGLGRMGIMVAREMAERKVPVVAIEKDLEACRQADAMQLLCVMGDAADEETLQKAGIEKARSLVAVLRSDADNVYIALTARQLRPDLFIVARAEQPSTEPKLRRAGANRVISPQAIGAERIANVVTRPHLVEFVDVATKGFEFEMDAVVLAPDSPVVGKSLRDANLRATADVMVVGIRKPDGTTHFNPPADEILRAQDTLITIGPGGAASRLMQLRLMGQSAPADV